MVYISTRVVCALASLVLSGIGFLVVNKYPVKPKMVANAMLLLPSAAACASAITGATYGTIMHLMLSCPDVATMVLYAFAILPFVLGVLVDAPIAWFRYRMRSQSAGRLSWKEFQLVSKFGHPRWVVKGEGRFDLSGLHLVFALTCNLLSATSIVLLLMFANTIPGLVAFVSGNEGWLSLLAVLPFAALAMTLIHSCKQQEGMRPKDTRSKKENPDNYLLDRLSVMANTFFIVTTVSLGVSLMGVIVAYCWQAGALFELSPVFVGLMISVLAYLWWTSVSPLANYFESKSKGLWAGGLIFSIMAALFTVCIPFRFSFISVVAIAICVAAGVLSSKAKLRRFDAVGSFPMLLLLEFFFVLGVYFWAGA